MHHHHRRHQEEVFHRKEEECQMLHMEIKDLLYQQVLHYIQVWDQYHHG